MILNKQIQSELEFCGDLVDHPIGNQNIYRLRYINYHRIGENYGIKRPDNIGVIDWPFKPFILPEGMKREDSFKVLSYLTDFIEREASLEPCSYSSVQALDKVIDINRLGFKRVNMTIDKDSSEVIDLFTITGRIGLFKKNRLYQKYFDWYTEGVTKEEVVNIYNKIGIDFYDLVPTISDSDEEKVLELNKNSK